MSIVTISLIVIAIANTLMIVLAIADRIKKS